MTFLLLHRWTDGAPVFVKAASIISIRAMPAESTGDPSKGAATVINQGTHGYTNWLKDSPEELLALIEAAGVVEISASPAPEGEEQTP